jgi:hypothetical protein
MNNDINEKIVHAAPVPPFVRFVASAVPMVFDNSLSYYEALCALWKWMQDNLVDVINNNATVTEHYIDLDLETRSLFNQLKTYVDTYFDNLDVQDEINNKLDAMAEAGTLQEIITAYIQSNVAWTFDTVADMKASTNLIDGSYAKTLGYASLNDGGGGVYKIREITNTDVIDNTHIIPVGSDSLIAELINPHKINPNQFYGATDTAKMQNAIDYAKTLYDSGTPVSIVLDRMYTITQPLVINTTVNRLPFKFVSTGNGGFNKSSSGYLFTTTQSYVSDITFDNVAFTSTSGGGLIVIESPKFINIKFVGCTFKNVDQAVFSDTYLQAISFVNCLITGGSDHFVEFKGSYDLNFDNCTIEHRTNSYLIYQESSNIVYNKQFFTNVTNCLIEGFGGSTSGFIHITAYDEINIINNYFEAMYNLIWHENNVWGGVLNIKNNKFQQSTNIATYNTTGMLRLVPNGSGVIIMGKINMDGNTINNTYAIYFDVVKLIRGDYSIRNPLNFSNNYVASAITNNSYASDGLNNNALFNIKPVFELTTGTDSSKYDRVFWNISNKITWNEDIVVNDVTYPVYYSYKDGSMYVTELMTYTVPTTETPFKFYFGIDIYMDDIYSVGQTSNLCNILSTTRAGSGNSKYLQTRAVSTDASAVSRSFIATVLLCGRRG